MNLQEAANTLDHILDRIDNSIDDDRRLTIRQELLEFKRSLPWESEFAELRRLAQEAFDDLGEAVNQSVLNRMRMRGKELAKYVEVVTGVTSRTEKNIETLRLKHIRMITTSAKAAADAVRAIKSSIETGDLPTASEKTEQALDLILKLVDDVAKEG